MSNEFGKMPPRPWQDRRYGECVHGNGMAVCQECKDKRNPTLQGFKDGEELQLEDESTKIKLKKAFAELLKLPPGDPRASYKVLNIEKFCKTCGNLDYRWLGMDGQPPGMETCNCDEHCAAFTPDEPAVLKNTGYADLDLFLDDCFKTMREKGHDYRQGNDADLLHNFRTVAGTVGVDMMKVWFTYFYKHYSAMATFIKEGGQSESEPIEGRIKDQIVYLLLFYRMVQEKKAPVQQHPV